MVFTVRCVYTVCKNLKEKEIFEVWRNLGRVPGGEDLALKNEQNLI